MALERPKVSDARFPVPEPTVGTQGDVFHAMGDTFQVIQPEPALTEREEIRKRLGSSQLVNDMIGCLSQDLIPLDDQEAILMAMSPSAQRTLVAKIGGLDASILLTVKKQIQIVDAVLRRMVSEDGTALPGAEDYDMPLKDALMMSMRVTQMIVKDLPKVYNLSRIQKQEEALRRVMENHLSPAQQELLLEELEKVEMGN